MRSIHTREQDFMAITAEVEILCQQLKGKGMYTIPPALPTTSDSKPSNNVHFRPIDLAQKSSVQTMDQSLLNSSLNLLDDSPQSQSSSSNGQIPCGQTTPQGSAHESSYPCTTQILGYELCIVRISQNSYLRRLGIALEFYLLTIPVLLALQQRK